VVDIHPDEVTQVLYLIKLLNSSLQSIIENQFKIAFNVPLLLEAKIGDNWLDTKDVS